MTGFLLELDPEYPFNRRGSDRTHQESQLELGKNCPVKGNKLLVHNLKTELLVWKDSLEIARRQGAGSSGEEQKGRQAGLPICLEGEQ